MHWTCAGNMGYVCMHVCDGGGKWGVSVLCI